MKKEQVLGDYSGDGHKLWVNGFDVYANEYEEKEYSKYWSMVSSKVLYNDYVDLTSNNKLLQLLIDGTIDKPLYRALYLIKTFRINKDDIWRRRHITDKMRYTALKDNFKLWYNRSRIKLPFSFAKKLLELIKTKTKITSFDIDKCGMDIIHTA